MTRTTKANQPDEIVRGPRKPAREIEVVNYRRTPSKYTEDMPHRIYVMATLGLSIPQMADSTGVSPATVDNWLANRTEVRTAYDTGKYEHDFGMEMALKRKAEGYEYQETKHYSGVDSLGRVWSRSVTQIIKVPGDTTAMIFWLKNRSRHRWQESHHNTSTNIQVNNINMENFTAEEKAMARSMAIKQLSSMNVIDSE